MTRTAKVEAVIPYSHKVLVTPTCIPVGLVGAVVGVQDIGEHEIIVDGFSDVESAEIETNLSANRGVYCTIGTATYRIINVVKTADEITTIFIYPGLEAATTVSEVITVGGPDIAIDIGIIGDEGLSVTSDITNDDAKSEYGTVTSRISMMENAMLKSPTTLINIDNYLLLAPNSFFVIKDGDVKFNYGNNAGFYEAVECSVKVVSVKDPTDISRWQNYESCLMSLTDFSLAGNKDRTKYLNVEFLLNSSDKLISFGDTSAAYV